MQRNFEPMRKQVEAWKGTRLPDEAAKLIIYRPNIEIGQSLGYLPGSLEEKFAPWTRPVFDNLELLHGGEDDENRQAERDAVLARYRVNLVVDNGGLAGAPVIADAQVGSRVRRCAFSSRGASVYLFR